MKNTPDAALDALEKAIAQKDQAAASKAYLDLQMTGAVLLGSMAKRREAAEAAYVNLMEHG